MLNVTRTRMHLKENRKISAGNVFGELEREEKVNTKTLSNKNAAEILVNSFPPLARYAVPKKEKRQKTQTEISGNKEHSVPSRHFTLLPYISVRAGTFALF